MGRVGYSSGCKKGCFVYLNANIETDFYHCYNKFNEKGTRRRSYVGFDTIKSKTEISDD